MPSTVLANWTKMVVVAGGTGNLELASVLGYPTLTQTAGLNTGVHYVILSADGEPIETGIGQIGAGNVFTRTEVLETFADGVYDTTSPAAADVPAGATVHTAVTKGLLTDLLAANAALGKKLLGHWSAEAISPRASNGCEAAALFETAVNKVCYRALAFDAASDEFCQFRFKAPRALSEASGISVELEISSAAGATAHNSSWLVQIAAIGHGDVLDAAWSPAATVLITTAPGALAISAETGTIMPSGPWQPGDMIYVQVSRKATDVVNDTLNVDAHLIGVTLFAIYDTGVEP